MSGLSECDMCVDAAGGGGGGGGSCMFESHLPQWPVQRKESLINL